MTRADLGRAKVQGMLAAVSKVTVATTMSRVPGGGGLVLVLVVVPLLPLVVVVVALISI